jgi:hypothetical protein
MIGQDRQTKIGIGKSFAAPLHFAKFGRLVQTLARLERQFTDRWSVLNAESGTEALAPLGAAAGEQPATALRRHASAKAVGSGTM